MAIDSRTLGGAIVRKSIEINASQNWTAPVNLAGNTVWITASGGGGGGRQTINFYTRDGNGGEWCEKRPVAVTAGSTYTVVIGAGGAVLSSGGNTTFGGTLLSVRGGSGGVAAGSSSWGFANEKGTIGTHGTIAIPIGSPPAGTSVWTAPVITLPANLPPGRSENGEINDSSPRQYVAGYGPGYFGDSGVNSGAGGPLNTSGFSGKLVIEWEEFL